MDLNGKIVDQMGKSWDRRLWFARGNGKHDDWPSNATKWGPQTIAKLVYNSNNYGFMVLITIVTGAYKPTYNWGGPHCTLPFSPTAECFGVSAHIAFGVIRGTARPCRLVSPVPGTRVPGTQGSGNQGSGQGSGNPRFREPGSASFRRFREPGFREPRVPGTRIRGKVPGTQGSANQGLSKVPGTLGCRTMASSSQSLDCAKVLESPEHQFWNMLETQSLGNQGSGKVLATLGSDKVPGTTAAADPEFGYTPWSMP